MNPGQPPLAQATAGANSGAEWLFHASGAAFLLLALFSWFLIADYVRPTMQQGESSYQLLGVLFALAFLSFVPYVAYCLYYLRQVSGMGAISRLMLGIYTIPLVCSWVVAVFIYR